MNKIFFVFAITFLFFGISVSSSNCIGSNILSVEDEFIEVSFININKNDCITYNKKLSFNEIKEIQKSFDYMEGKLKECKNNNEFDIVFNENIEKLCKYGLLSEDNELIQNNKSNFEKILSKKNLNFLQKKTLFDNSNWLCSIAGNTTNTGFSIYLDILEELFGYFEPFIIFFPLRIYIIRDFLKLFNYKVNEMISFGYFESIHSQIPSSGWVWTNGLNGIKNYTGKFFGDILPPPFPDFNYIGVKGFSGIIININGQSYFQGHALRVKIEPV